MTACSVVTVTGADTAPAPPSGAQLASLASGAGRAVGGSVCTCTAKPARPACLDGPSSRCSSASVTSPAALLAGSGNSTCRPSAEAGPPSLAGSRNRQLTELPNAGVSAAADRGITMTSVVRASVRPAGRIRVAAGPCANPAHRLASGIQAAGGWT